MNQPESLQRPWWEAYLSSIAFLIVVVLVGALGLGIWILSRAGDRIVDSAGASLSFGATKVAEKLDTLLSKQAAQVQLTARQLGEQGIDSTSVRETLLMIKKGSPLPVWIVITDSAGKVVGTTNEQFLGEELNHPEWFEGDPVSGNLRISITGGVQTESGEVNPLTSKPSLVWSSIIVNDGEEKVGNVIARLDMSMLEPFFPKTVQMIEPRLSLFSKNDFSLDYSIITPQGLIVFDSDVGQVGRVTTNLLPLLSGASDDMEPSGFGFIEGSLEHRQVPFLIGYATIQGLAGIDDSHWMVLLRTEKANIVASVQKQGWKVALAWALLGLPAGAFLLWMTGRLQMTYSKAHSDRLQAAEMKQMLAEREEQTRLLVDSVPDAMIGFDQGGRIIDWNVQAERMFGWSRVEMIGRTIWTTVIPESSQSHMQGIMKRILQGQLPRLGGQQEIVVCRYDRFEFPVELAMAPARMECGFVFSAFFRDISGRKLSERRLQLQYEITQVLSEAGTIQEASTRIVKTICNRLGWELGQCWGVDRFSQTLRVRDVWHHPSLDPSEFIVASKTIALSLGIGLPGRVWEIGSPVWIRDVVQDQNFPRLEVAGTVGLHSAFAFPIKVGGKVHGVFEFYSQDIREPDKDLLEMVEEIGINVGQFVERKEAEAALTETEAQLRQAQKMEAIGRVAGGVAHDFNNLLTVITGYTQLLLSQLGSNDPMRNEVEEIRKAGNRAASLTGQLLAFSRRQVIAPQILDLNTVVTNMEGMLRRLMGEDIIELVTVLDPDLGRIKADPGQIDQVIMNLAVNARDAMPQGGRLALETSNALITDLSLGETGLVQPGSYVLLTLTDTGCGMDEATLSKVFEPFFTTKDQGKGTGLGLSTVYGIVKQNGGDIVVDSEVGRGTKVRIYFPRVDEELSQDKKDIPVNWSEKAGETILVVEDEPGVRGLVTAALRTGGYSVLEARDGIHAQVVSKSHFGQIDLLLTDVVMPQKSGPEAAKELLVDRPNMKVLYMSGYPDHPVFSHGPVDKTKLLMQKPFMPENLTRRVREVLEMSGEEFKRLHPVP